MKDLMNLEKQTVVLRTRLVARVSGEHRLCGVDGGNCSFQLIL